MIGSKSVVNLSNRFVHCIGDEKVGRIDIGMKSSLTSGNSLVPDQIIKTPELYTALAWDNLEPILFTIRTEFAIKIYHQKYKFLKKSLKPNAKRGK